MRAYMAGLVLVAILIGGCGGSDDDNILRSPSRSNEPAVVITVPAAPSGSSGAGSTPSGSPGAASNGSSASFVVEPCKLLTREDATAAMGTAAGEGKASDSPSLGAKVCEYEASNNLGNSIELNVITTQNLPEALRRTGYNAKKQYTDYKALAKDAVLVSGIGDEALVRGRVVQVLKGDVVIDITLFTDDEPGGTAYTNVLKTVAAKVASRLP